MRASLLVLFVTCLICLGLGEIVARLFLSAPQLVVVQKASDLEQRLTWERDKRYHLTLPTHPEEGRGYLYIMTQTGRRLRANIEILIENHLLSHQRIHLQTNALGYRNPELDAEKNRFRILFLGDSITFGDYVQEEETFVRLVENQAALHGQNWETINAGVGGISLKNEISILYETGLLTRPDVVVVGFYLNDFQESPGVYIRSMPSLLQRSRLLFHAARLVQLYTAVENSENERTDTRYETADVESWQQEFENELATRNGRSKEEIHFMQEVLESFGDWGGAWSPHMWQLTRPLFTELKRLSGEHGFELLVVAFPVRQQVEAEGLYDYPQARLAELATDLNIPLLDLLPLLREERQRSAEPIYYDHCHHTPYGNQVIAGAIYRFLDERL